jgi:hypothetical protein
MPSLAFCSAPALATEEYAVAPPRLKFRADPSRVDYGDLIGLDAPVLMMNRDSVIDAVVDNVPLAKAALAAINTTHATTHFMNPGCNLLAAPSQDLAMSGAFGEVAMVTTYGGNARTDLMAGKTSAGLRMLHGSGPSGGIESVCFVIFTAPSPPMPSAHRTGEAEQESAFAALTRRGARLRAKDRIAMASYVASLNDDIDG